MFGEKISKQHHIQAMKYLQTIAFVHISSEKRQKLEQRSVQNIQCGKDLHELVEDRDRGVQCGGEGT